MNNNVPISIVLPAHNEEGNIKKTVEEVFYFFEGHNVFSQYEIIVVDDGSTDQTPIILKELEKRIECLVVVNHSNNLGYGGALISGLRKARFSWVVIMDADGQFRINSICSMFDYMSRYDIITGCRNNRSDSWCRIILGRSYAILASIIFGLKIKDINCGFKLFKKDALDFKRASCHAGVFFTDVFITAKVKGLKVKEVPIEHFSRLKGRQSGASLKVIFMSLIDVIRLFFNVRTNYNRETVQDGRKI
ncbi:MAG: glycosyltransferase family 2 protein [Candidatus Omnitrophica bacterium]|nr:glycosyltransferase family 2 protein [Candidatus Omnitrophota bacterium]